jgi:hypothetical protein
VGTPIVTKLVGIVLATVVVAAAWTLAHRYELHAATGDVSVVAWRLDRLTGQACRIVFLGNNQTPDLRTSCTP